MAIINQVVVEVFHVLENPLRQRSLGESPTTTILPVATAPSQTTSATPTMSSSSNSSGPTSSPLLFFVALGFGVVFTNLWIIVGVKYCFRYNARNRALRNGEEIDPINLENMPTRPHRRRREKKLMTMDEVNERFPLTKYKNWVASRAREGLPTTGGVTSHPSRAGSVRQVGGVIPSSPTDTKHSIPTRPNTPGFDGEAAGIRPDNGRKSMDAKVVEKAASSPAVEEQNRLEEVNTTSSFVDKHTTNTEEEDEDDDHIHTAVPPELLTNPGDSCAICIDTLEDDDDIRGLTCGHAFHAGCLDPWLTSRRACCPLCKADYFTPKPRPEGEATETNDRSGRRRDRNMPQPPPSAWTGIRGNPRLIFPGRFGTPASYPGDATQGQSRAERRARRAAAQDNRNDALTEGAENNAAAGQPRRWMPRIGNPFRRSPINPPDAPEETSVSPSQLEAGVVR